MDEHSPLASAAAAAAAAAAATAAAVALTGLIPPQSHYLLLLPLTAVLTTPSFSLAFLPLRPNPPLYQST